jgi:hypothetical protein
MIRPAYWTDADLHTRLSAEVREFYVGCWMQSDDAGYIAWDVDRVGADLYPYRGLAWRRAHLPKWMDLLAVNRHVVILDCGKHALVPNLARYQACPKPSYQNQRAHDACMRHMAPRGATGDPVVPAQEGKGRERKGRGLNGGADGAKDGTTTDGLKARLGDYAAVIANGATPEEALGTLEARPDYAVAVGSPAGQELLETIRKRDAARRAS